MGPMKDLADVVRAVDAGAEIKARVDNDNITFYDGDVDVLALHPYDVTMQALELIGIEGEPV